MEFIDDLKLPADYDIIKSEKSIDKICEAPPLDPIITLSENLNNDYVAEEIKENLIHSLNTKTIKLPNGSDVKLKDLFSIGMRMASILYMIGIESTKDGEPHISDESKNLAQNLILDPVQDKADDFKKEAGHLLDEYSLENGHIYWLDYEINPEQIKFIICGECRE